MTEGIYLVTPSNDGNFCGGYVAGLLELQRLARNRTESGIDLTFVWGKHTGSSHICMARNFCAHRFLNETDLSHMLFVDADIEFRGRDALALYDLGLDLVGGTYPRKTIDWESAFNAARAGRDLEQMKRAAYSFCGRLDGDTVRFKPALSCLVSSHLPTGFMMVSRKAFETIAAAHPMERFADGKVNFFGYPNGNERGEDFRFCELASQAGIEPHMYLKAQLNHVGTHTYRGFEWQAALTK